MAGRIVVKFIPWIIDEILYPDDISLSYNCFVQNLNFMKQLVPLLKIRVGCLNVNNSFGKAWSGYQNQIYFEYLYSFLSLNIFSLLNNIMFFVLSCGQVFIFQILFLLGHLANKQNRLCYSVFCPSVCRPSVRPNVRHLPSVFPTSSFSCKCLKHHLGDFNKLVKYLSRIRVHMCSNKWAGSKKGKSTKIVMKC